MQPIVVLYENLQGYFILSDSSTSRWRKGHSKPLEALWYDIQSQQVLFYCKGCFFNCCTCHNYCTNVDKNILKFCAANDPTSQTVSSIEVITFLSSDVNPLGIYVRGECVYTHKQKVYFIHNNKFKKCLLLFNAPVCACVLLPYPIQYTYLCKNRIIQPTG